MDSVLRQKLALPLRELVVAPMVDASELAFRMLCRKYGATVAYTPMLHARVFLERPMYREKKFTTCAEDRPLVVQFCGHDKDVLLKAAKYVEGQCDAIDLNLGCPQNIARRGRYGSFLLDETELLSEIVSHLCANLSVPVTCKIRLVSCEKESVEKSIRLAKTLEAAGCALLTVHGRTKEEKGHHIGAANWDAIRQIKQALSIPVVANGGIGSWPEAEACRQATGADALMSSEAILENPTLVAGMEAPPSPFQVALDYLDMAEKYQEASRKIIRSHVLKLLYAPMIVHPQDREAIVNMRGPASEEANGQKKKARDDDNIVYIGRLRDAVGKMKREHDEGLCALPCCKAQEPSHYYPWYDRHRKQNEKLYENAVAQGQDREEKLLKGTPPPMSREQVLLERAERKRRKREGRAEAALRKQHFSQFHHKAKVQKI